MKKIYILLISIISLPAFSQAVWRTKYFPVGTKWTELSLDTTKYDSWYSMVAGEWVPNYEQVDYYVEKDTAVVFYDLERPTTKVNRYREGKPDPLSYILIENMKISIRDITEMRKKYVSPSSRKKVITLFL